MKKYRNLLFVALASLVMFIGCAQTTPDTAKAAEVPTVVPQSAPDTTTAAVDQTVVPQTALDFPHAILLRSKEKKNLEAMKWVKDSTEENVEVLKVVEVQEYEEIFLELDLSYTEEVKPFLRSQYVQEGLVKFLSATSKYSDSLVVKYLSQAKDAKTLDEAIVSLSKFDGFDVFVMGEDTASFNAEVGRYPDSRKMSVSKTVTITEENGTVIAKLDKHSVGGELSELYDVELGKRIQLSDLLLNLRVKKNKYSEDSVTVTGIKYIHKNEIRFIYENPYGVSIEKDDSLLTDYARSLMAKDKGYSVSTTTSASGDKIRKYHFEYFTEKFNPYSVIEIPMDLNGCSNTSKIRNRMLEVMFGKSNGNLDSLVVDGFEKSWVPKNSYSRGPNMLLKQGNGLVSFGFEDRERRDNSGNVFIVFDKKTGEEITVNDLIKDKDGFMQFVNSHNLYLAGFLADSANIKELLYNIGPEFKSYLRHSGGMRPFPGLEEFPTSWWFAFNKMDEIVPVEFNTSTARVFLNYSDIKKYIDPKYLETLDSAVKSIKKE